MKSNKFFVKIGVAVLSLIFVASDFNLAFAGTITPPSGSPSAKFYTLTEIFDLINSNTTTTEGSHTFTFADALAGGGKTLTEIYNALTSLIDPTKILSGTTYLGTAGTMTNVGAQYIVPTTASTTITAGYHSGSGSVAGDADLISDNIKSGINIFGVSGDSNVVDTSAGNATANLIASSSIAFVDGSQITGTLLGNMWNGTRSSGVWPGGSQSNGGVDDYNNAGAPPSDRYSTGWTLCTSDNNYCDTGESGADAKDNATGLVWSLPCNGAGCDSFSDASPMTYAFSTTTSGGSGANSWSTVNNAYLDVATTTAGVYTFCQNGDHGRTGWFAPTQKQLMQAYIDGSYGYLDSGVNRAYWSATTVSNNLANAWFTYLSNGYTFSTTKLTNTGYIRCVRPGN